MSAFLRQWWRVAAAVAAGVTVLVGASGTLGTQPSLALMALGAIALLVLMYTGRP